MRPEAVTGYAQEPRWSSINPLLPVVDEATSL